MANQILPITQLDQIGVILDTPPAALPPNAFSDVRNARFKDGAIRKMEGEVNIFPNFFDDSNNLIGGVAANFNGSILKYVVWWPNPNLIALNKGYYLVIAEETRLVSDDSIPEVGNTAPTHQRDIAYIVNVDGSTKVQKGVFATTALGSWQHTFFQGGFSLIINNGLDIPHYILDEKNNTNINSVPNFAELPGWDSYEVNEILLQDIFDTATDSYIFDLGRKVDFSIEKIVVIDYDESTGAYTEFLAENYDALILTSPNNTEYVAPDYSTFTGDPTLGNSPNSTFEIYFDSASNSHIIFLPQNLNHGSHLDRLTISIQSRDQVFVRCGVIRSFGDFLVAGNLVERNGLDFDSPIVRNLNSVIRTSDAAPPGSMPNNWNPFAAGVSTADEFVVADTGVVQDMAEMQGNLYIYANNSISVMRLTGNPTVPLSVTPVTNTHGCQTTNAVLEYEGKHFVVGSQDMYVFGGHPGSIQSVSENRVRRFFFKNLNPLNANRMFIVRYSQRDEIWICYPTLNSTTGDCDRALIWNYKSNVWTRRDLRGVISGDIGPIPGGGLPFTEIDLSGVSGSNGVTNVGAYEVRTIGVDSTLTFNGNKDFYIGGNTKLIYGTGRNGDTTREEVDGVRDFYEDTIYPSVSLTGPEGTSVSFSLTNPNASQYDNADGDDVISQIATNIEALNGWSFSSLPSGYSQLTGSNRLVATVDGTNILGLRKVTNTIPFNVTITNAGNTISGQTLALDFQESTNVSSVHGIIKSDSNDYRGQYVLRSTPTYLAVQVRAEDQPGGSELIIVKAGNEVDYDVTTHTGSTNGITLANEATAEAWIEALTLASPRLRIVDGGTDGEFTIQPASYSDLADFVIDVRINDTVENAQWIWDRYQEAVAGTIGLNPNGVIPYVNGVDELGTTTLAVHSTAPAIAGSLDTQLSPDPTRTPSRTTVETAATMGASISINNVFDIDRPWPKNEINPNLEYPILASKQVVSEAGNNYTINKILGTDVGWTVPSYSYTPRTETEDSDEFKIVITNNDAPVPYESYFERKQLAITPEFDTETIRRIALWAGGSYTPYVNSPNVFNRLQIRTKGTDNPGRDISLNNITTNSVNKNTFYISEDYKVDTRVHGRYINYRITDVIMDDDNTVLTRTSNPKNDNSVLYSQAAEWTVSGMQPEIGKGGSR